MTRHESAPLDPLLVPPEPQIERVAPHLGAACAPEFLLESATPHLSRPPISSPRRLDVAALVTYLYRAGLALVCLFVCLGMGFAVLGTHSFDGVSRKSYSPWALMDFSKKGNVDDYLGAGWGPANLNGRWTRGDIAELTIPLPNGNSKILVMQLIFETRVDPRAPQLDLQILANGSTVLTRSYDASGQQNETVSVPLEPTNGGDKLILTFMQDSPVAPIFADGGDWLHISSLRVRLTEG